MALPRWLNFSYEALNLLPATQLRLFLGALSAETVIAYLLVAMWTGHKLDPIQLEYTLVFIGALNGIAVGSAAFAQFGSKAAGAVAAEKSIEKSIEKEIKP